ncbi:MAG: hypothetical protein AAF489_02910 [Bacteroidota bacterium]
MKNLMNANGAHELSTSELKMINGGGDPPCGGTGGLYRPDITTEAECNFYHGSDWHNGKCYICY